MKGVCFYTSFPISIHKKREFISTFVFHSLIHINKFLKISGSTMKGEFCTMKGALLNLRLADSDLLPNRFMFAAQQNKVCCPADFHEPSAKYSFHRNSTVFQCIMHETTNLFFQNNCKICLALQTKEITLHLS